MRSVWGWLIAVVLVGSVVGCASLPTSGPVNFAGEISSRDDQLSFLAPSPQPGDSPQQIVDSFLLAATEPAGGYAKAREFLTSAAKISWAPDAQTIVYRENSRRLVLSMSAQNNEVAAPDGVTGETSVSMTAEKVATINHRGVYTASLSGETLAVGFELAKEAGQWRISVAPRGLIVAASNLQLVFAEYSLYFLAPDKKQLVPDSRWFARRESIATTLTRELLAGPARHLSGSVESAFAPGTSLSAPGVVRIQDNRAEVDFALDFRSVDRSRRQLMHTQLLSTLRQVPQVAAVDMLSAGTALTAPDPLDLTPARPTQTQLLALREGKAVLWRNNSIVELGSAEQETPRAAAVAAVSLAVKRQNWYSLSEDGRQISRTFARATSPQTVLQGQDFLPPVVDTKEWLWAVPKGSVGKLVTVSAAAEPQPLTVPLNAGFKVTGMAVSPDATKLALTLAHADLGHVVAVVGIVRSASGAPTQVSDQPLFLLTELRGTFAVSWVTNEQLVALADVDKRTSAIQPVPKQERVLMVVDISGRLVDRFVVPERTSSFVVAGDVSSLVIAIPEKGLSRRAGSAWVPIPETTGLTAPSYAP